MTQREALAPALVAGSRFVSVGLAVSSAGGRLAWPANWEQTQEASSFDRGRSREGPRGDPGTEELWVKR